MGGVVSRFSALGLLENNDEGDSCGLPENSPLKFPYVGQIHFDAFCFVIDDDCMKI